MQSEKAKTRVWLKVMIPILSIALCGGTVEVIARIWEYDLAQSSTGWEEVASRRVQVIPSDNPDINALLEPNVDYFWEGIPVHINSHGLRDHERDWPKPEGVYRVLCLGDSIPFGWEVRLEDASPKLLEARLQAGGDRPYEVINAGVLGWDLPIELAYLEDIGLQYEPDLVIVAITVANDIYHNPYRITPPTLFDWLRENTSAWGFLSAQFRSLRDVVAGQTDEDNSEGARRAREPFPTDTSDAIWDRYIRTPLREMAAVAAENDVEILVVVFPAARQTLDVNYPTTAQEVVAQLGEELAIPIVDLLPVYQGYFAQNPPDVDADVPPALFADFSSHPSILGHQLAAEAIYRAIEQTGYLRER
jgi:lysophospholipase L1-like esterase